ncbi:TspO/MBR family protein [Roseomonas sp. HF4]|uniref:TspO/MBR family protein n=1 Tax=Roseomonas sp. HF4 TaxID=2562313 RepID=UPI0010C0AE7D|nr:TspO/MBR family protein [Roseomonas sp. HF4]
METSSIVALLVFFGLNFATAMSGAVFMPGEWYRGLAKPSWNPPDWAFAPAWAVLYVTIAVSGWLVWREAGLAGAALPLAVYVVQLLFNAGWSAVFFGLQRPDLAFAEVIGLWLSILATILLFWPVSQLAALLLLPYLAWVTFAASLNFAIWRLNVVN